MKMDKVAGSGNDEFYTPMYAVKPILPYLKEKKTIWCPFNTEDSLFVQALRAEGHEVIATHIFNGQDFFNTAIPNCDAVVSNPPYSLKTKVLERLFAINIPFAMLVGVVGLFESQKRYTMFKKNDFEIMYLNKRISYHKDIKQQGKCTLNPPFSSVYLCHHLLPKQIIFEEVDKSA